MTAPPSTPPDAAQLAAWSAFAERLADQAREMFLPHIGVMPAGAGDGPGVEVKADRSLVTTLDRAIEERLRTLIESQHPGHGIYGEEHGHVRLDADAVWVLDPIDGTAPFIAGVPVYGTLIALLWRGAPVIGVMDFPLTQDRWLGVAGKPTLHRGAAGRVTACRTRACASLAEAMLTCSNPDFLAAGERPALAALRERTRWRIYGGCCLAYGLLASGRTDLALDAGFKLYDYAPFVPVLEGAGGRITDWQGRPLGLHNPATRILAAGDPARHAEALALLGPTLHDNDLTATAAPA